MKIKPSPRSGNALFKLITEKFASIESSFQESIEESIGFTIDEMDTMEQARVTRSDGDNIEKDEGANNWLNQDPTGAGELNPNDIACAIRSLEGVNEN